MYYFTLTIILTLAFCASSATSTPAQEPWPAESWTEAELFTSLDPDFTHDMSGACWNPITRSFWVCCNGPGTFWQLAADVTGSLSIAQDIMGTPARYATGGDLEGICQADHSDDTVYLMAEPDTIRRYRIIPGGTASLEAEWDIGPFIPPYSSGRGAEGITFVPNNWLEVSGFEDSTGNQYTAQNGMEGLFFVAHQNGGRIYVFDLAPAGNSLTFVGSYLTSRNESSGLEFDRSTGLLYIWHNTGPNYLEVSRLSSVLSGAERQLVQVQEYLGPRSGNLEGIAMTYENDAHHWCLVLDDSNQDNAGVMLFKNFSPLPSPYQTATCGWNLLR
jgi:hypothetical protein